MENNIKNIEQERAKSAFEMANSGSKDYTSQVKKFPMYIKVNGFTNAMAFAYSKAFNGKNENEEWKKLYLDIGEWLKKEPQEIIRTKLVNYDKTKEKRVNLMNTIVNLNANELRLVTSEVLAFLNWLKRFVKDE